MERNERKFFASLAAILAAMAAVFWTIIELNGIVTGPHGEIGGFQVAAFLSTAGATLIGLAVVGEFATKLFWRTHLIKQPIYALAGAIRALGGVRNGMLIVSSIITAVLWIMIELNGIHTGPHGEIGGLQALAAMSSLAAGALWISVIVEIISGIASRSYLVRSFGALLNLIIILSSMVLLFTPRGLIAGMIGTFEQVERDFSREVNDEPGRHACIDGGGPATRAVVYGRNLGIIRWYCDPSKAPSFIRVPSSSVPVPSSAPVNILLLAVVAIAHFGVLAFGICLLARAIPTAMVPRFAHRTQKNLASGVDNNINGWLFLAYVIVVINLGVGLVPVLFPTKP